MIPKKSKEKHEAETQIGFGVEEDVFHRTANGKFVNLKTGEVRKESDFSTIKTFQKITLIK